MEILAIDHIEFYVGNGMHSAYYYVNAFGFKQIAYKGPETGSKEIVSYVLEQGNIRLVFTAPILPNHPITHFLSLHGDAVRSVAFLVDDAKKAWDLAINNGAQSAQEPMIIEDSDGIYVSAAVSLYGDIIHKFIEREKYSGHFSPGYFKNENSSEFNSSVGLSEIDHCTSNVEKGKLEEWINYYKKVLGFTDFFSLDDNDIYTDYSALMTKVVANKNQNIKLPLIQPIDKKWKSQIQEFIEYNSGPGVQHIAVTTNDIIKTVTLLRERGVLFLEISKEYYLEMQERIGNSGDNIDTIIDLNIMIDKENNGFIYQAFTKPLVDRPTFFIEIIQRKGAKAFGKGNVKEFFNALTLEQSKRGNI